MNEDKRKIGEYTVRNAMYVGRKEYALCENMNDPHGMFYMTCVVTANDLFEFYSEVLSSDNYLEIADLYTDRVKNAVKELIAEEKKLPPGIVTADMCDSIRDKNLEGEIIVIKANVLRPEYRSQAHQIVLAKGGNGARANARGSAVFCEYLTDCRSTRFERMDVLGILKKEHYPEWVKKRVEIIVEFKRNPDVFQYGNKHFIGIGELPPQRERNFNIHLRHDASMTFETHNGDKFQYNYRNFMNAANGSPCDVFKCYENGNLYIPGENELFHYTGKYRELGEQPQAKKKTHKEVER